MGNVTPESIQNNQWKEIHTGGLSKENKPVYASHAHLRNPQQQIFPYAQLLQKNNERQRYNKDMQRVGFLIKQKKTNIISFILLA